MANYKKFIDRNPEMTAAGMKNQPPTYGAKSTLQDYSLEEGAECLIKAKCAELMRKKSRYVVPCPFRPVDSITPVLTPELEKTRFVTFREKLAESMYCNKAPLGRAREPTAVPAGVTNMSRAYGARRPGSEPLYGVILPKKTVEQVNRESDCWHEQYILSHNHYFPGEQINRRYRRPSFNPRCAFGYSTKADLSGAGVRGALYNCNRLMVIDKSQKYFLESTLGSVGRKIMRYEMPVPPTTRFGRPSGVDACNLPALLTNVIPCADTTDLINAIGHLNWLRRDIASNPHFNINDFRAELRHLDVNNTDCLPFRKILEVAHRMYLRIDDVKIRRAMIHYGFLDKVGTEYERCNFEDFVDLLSLRFPLPVTGSISPVPAVMYDKETTYRQLCKDREKQSWRHDISKLEIERRKGEVDPTTVKDLVTPGIDVRIGLEDRDYLVPRPKQQMRRLFKHLKDNEFEEVWGICMEKTKHASDLLPTRLVIDEAKKYVLAHETYYYYYD